MNKLIIVAVDDWEVLYGPDGEKLYEDHSIRGENMFTALQKVPQHPKELEIDYEYLEGDIVDDLFDGESPNNLTIIKEYQEKNK
tara:strand:- start:10009 stop:10260 length:252 start_codon:yes stop_codon:yes gene_type:complete